ncbi:hypothetical protein V8G54_015241 [Vigna mungo]|uniref:Uncharacterized protein n=1 Tax=Vigna mungo TaxID=3915 RepID=A0AAQ3S002_VIGMU
MCPFHWNPARIRSLFVPLVLAIAPRPRCNHSPPSSVPRCHIRCFAAVTHRRGQRKKCLKRLLPENPPMEALVAESKELLTWALVKVAHPGDTVVALHVLGNQGDDSHLILWDARSALVVTV